MIVLLSSGFDRGAKAWGTVMPDECTVREMDPGESWNMSILLAFE